MITGLIIVVVIIILIYSYGKVENQESLCKETYNYLQECLMKRYDIAEHLTTYVAQFVNYYQKPMTRDFKALREANRVRFYEIEHIETYLTEAIIKAIKIAEEETDVVKGDEYYEILKELNQNERYIYYALIECNRQRELYNEKLHVFPIILFARFYGYQDKAMLQIPLATYPPKEKK